MHTKPTNKIQQAAMEPGQSSGKQLILSLLSLALALGLTVRAACSKPEKQDKNKAASVNSLLAGKKDAFSKPYGYYLNPILKHINATSDQREKITEIVQNYRQQIEPLRGEYRQKNKVLLDKLSHSDNSESIMEEQMRLGRLYSDITLYYCQMSLEVRKVLNPEQIVLYEEFKRKQGWNSSAKSSSN